MKWQALLTGSTLLASTLGLPSTSHVRHEKRTAPVFHRRERVDSNSIIPVRIGLKQSNLHTGYDRLMDVSHPTSENYGKHLSAEEVHSIFAPAEDTVQTVRDWLTSSGISSGDILAYENKGWLAIDMAAKDAERLFRTEYYEHEVSDGHRIGCDEYYLPSHVSKHVDFIKPGVKFSPPLKKRVVKRSEWPHGGDRPGFPKPPHTHPNPYPHWHMPPAAHGLPPQLQHCGVSQTDRWNPPLCLRHLLTPLPDRRSTSLQLVSRLCTTFQLCT